MESCQNIGADLKSHGFFSQKCGFGLILIRGLAGREDSLKK